MTTWNLSDKMLDMDWIAKEVTKDGNYIHKEDVKEFIKRLKDNLKENQYLCFNSIMNDEIDKEIDKLAGESLI